MEYSWITVPKSQMLEDKSRWTQLANNCYAGIMHTLLVVEKDAVVKNGPLLEQMDWPANSEYNYQRKKKTIIKYTAGINESITSAVTQQFSTEVITKVNSDLTVGKLLSATLSAELQEKVNTQLTESLSRGLSTTKTFEFQDENEFTETLKFTVPKGKNTSDTRKVTIFNKVKEISWDVYLYKSDYLQLEYHKFWLWKDVRKTIRQEDALLKEPLFSITFFEPLSSLSYCFDEYESEVTNLSEIRIETVVTPCPSRILPNIASMDKLAKIAFPVTKVELKDAEDQRRKQMMSFKQGRTRMMNSKLGRTHLMTNKLGRKQSMVGKDRVALVQDILKKSSALKRIDKNINRITSKTNASIVVHPTSENKMKFKMTSQKSAESLKSGSRGIHKV